MEEQIELGDLVMLRKTLVSDGLFMWALDNITNEGLRSPTTCALMRNEVAIVIDRKSFPEGEMLHMIVTQRLESGWIEASFLEVL